MRLLVASAAAAASAGGRRASAAPRELVFRLFRRMRHSIEPYPAFLTEDVPDIGLKGDVVLVKAGTARVVIRHMRRGLMLPRNRDYFLQHESTYAKLGYPTPMMHDYYAGRVPVVRPIAKNAGANIAQLLSASELLAGRRLFVRELRDLSVVRIKAATVVDLKSQHASGNAKGISRSGGGAQTGTLLQPLGPSLVRAAIRDLALPRFEYALTSDECVSLRHPVSKRILPQLICAGNYEIVLKIEMVPEFVMPLIVSECDPREIEAAAAAMAKKKAGNLDFKLFPPLSSQAPSPAPDGKSIPAATVRIKDLKAKEILSRKHMWYGTIPPTTPKEEK